MCVLQNIYLMLKSFASQNIIALLSGKQPLFFLKQVLYKLPKLVRSIRFSSVKIPAKGKNHVVN